MDLDDSELPKPTKSSLVAFAVALVISCCITNYPKLRGLK